MVIYQKPLRLIILKVATTRIHHEYLIVDDCFRCANLLLIDLEPRVVRLLRVPVFLCYSITLDMFWSPSRLDWFSFIWRIVDCAREFVCGASRTVCSRVEPSWGLRRMCVYLVDSAFLPGKADLWMGGSAVVGVLEYKWKLLSDSWARASR